MGTRPEPGGSPDAFAERCAALAALGLQHVIVITTGPWTEDAVATLAAAGRPCGRCDAPGKPDPWRHPSGSPP